jgi:hypothetical protein
MPQLRKLAAGFSQWQPRLDCRSDYVGFVVEKVALGPVFSKDFSFPCQFSFQQLLHMHQLSYHQHYIIPILTVSLNNELKNSKSSQPS